MRSTERRYLTGHNRYLTGHKGNLQRRDEAVADGGAGRSHEPYGHAVREGGPLPGIVGNDDLGTSYHGVPLTITWFVAGLWRDRRDQLPYSSGRRSLR
ncbi:hypothetical protein Sliba_68570 [Streptomyces nigrescens]|uniref:Uncharacterized protein n=1 Tax=Streptomyces nigrescens TaxID=1920 RepID=A0A640TT45_STRNI|nr:hypothetical protein Sliba_68570 [Streptomyces libani subsp. libani]GGW07684.1 hypothetical protein GCM10010500_76920 [Streptomyces libani subsp. libani]